MRARFTVAVALVAQVTGLAAQKNQGHGSDLSVGVRFGTLGVGAEVSKLVTSHIGLRVQANFLSLTKRIDETDITFDGSLKMHAISGLVDLYPGKRGSFHLSGGVITSPIEVTGTGVPTASEFTINDKTYQSSAVGTLTGTGKWPSASPYVGFGFGTPAASHAALRFVFDIGAVIGKAKIGLTATGASQGSTLQSDLDAQVAKTQDDVNKVPVYPVIQFGLVVRF